MVEHEFFDRNNGGIFRPGRTPLMIRAALKKAKADNHREAQNAFQPYYIGCAPRTVAENTGKKLDASEAPKQIRLQSQLATDPVPVPENTTDLAALLDIPDPFTPEQREANQLLLEEHLSTKLGKYTAEYILQEGSSFDSGLADATDIELALNACSAHISLAELKVLWRIHDEVTGGGSMSKDEANVALKELEGERIEKAKAAQEAARDARKARSNKKSKKRSPSKQPKGTQPAKRGGRAGPRSKSIVHDESDTPEPEGLEKPRRWISREADWKDYLQAVEHSKSDSVSDSKAEDWGQVSSWNECMHGHDKRFPSSEASISEPDLEFGPWVEPSAERRARGG